jgi:hypothetical protein
MNNELLEICDEMRDHLSTTIKIDHSQVLEIVVGDLVEKYRSNLERKENRWINVFKDVLSYYLTEDELIEYLGEGKN